MPKKIKLRKKIEEKEKKRISKEVKKSKENQEKALKASRKPGSDVRYSSMKGKGFISREESYKEAEEMSKYKKPGWMKDRLGIDKKYKLPKELESRKGVSDKKTIKLTPIKINNYDPNKNKKKMSAKEFKEMLKKEAKKNSKR